MTMQIYPLDLAESCGERKYIAVSIKHTEYRWKFGKPLVLWGYKRTADNEERCFAGYTEYPGKCERYAIGEFQKKGYMTDIKDDAPVEMTLDFCKKNKKWDTVLVDAEQVIGYCKMCCLPIDAPKEG